jgi:hypothetical protein
MFCLKPMLLQCSAAVVTVISLRDRKKQCAAGTGLL